jgi:hypothetical protein
MPMNAPAAAKATQTYGQKYSVTPHPVNTLLAWIQSGEIAIPEIQRPFVWDATQVRNLLDSLYRGYPIGYLISWKNPTVQLKDGTRSEGKRILIDGQQRMTALTTALLGQTVLTKDYDEVKIRIAFHPVEEKFEVHNPAIQKDPAWIPDISAIFAPGTKILALVKDYVEKNPSSTEDDIFRALEALKGILNNHVGLIELSPELDIETVTQIFIRVNSLGTPLSQADFAMSKIASNHLYGGNVLRKAIDYFCQMATAPETYAKIEKDKSFASSEFFSKMAWLKNESDDIYDPSYVDMLRVAFTSEFQRGRLQDLVALLSGRNFESKQYEEAIVEQSFSRLKQGLLSFINEQNFKRMIMIVRSAGFADPSLITSQNALNFAYVVYLLLRAQKVAPAKIESLVRRWFVMSLLTGRYSGQTETTFDSDIRQMNASGVEAHLKAVEAGQLSSAFWEVGLPQDMETSSVGSPYFKLFLAAQVKAHDKGFLSRDISVLDLILNRADVHHLFPKKYLKDQGFSRSRYNQIANFVLTQTEINIAIGDTAPAKYFSQLQKQCETEESRYGGIVKKKEMLDNFEAHCVPEGVYNGLADEYEQFLSERRKLMAKKLKQYYFSL